MTLRGLLAYSAGVLTLFAGLGLFGLVVLYAFVLEPRPHAIGELLLVVSGVVVFAAAHLLAAGLYRMLVHLYATISRTDPATDRPLRGRSVYLLGQLGCAMAVPTTVVFMFLPGLNRGNAEMDKAFWGALPSGFFLMLALTIFFAGLGIMVYDTFVRNRDIVERREAERLRRLDETAAEPRTEIIPLPRSVDELRQHIKEDR